MPVANGEVGSPCRPGKETLNENKGSLERSVKSQEVSSPGESD